MKENEEDLFVKRRKELLFPSLWRMTKSEDYLESIVEGLRKRKSSEVIQFSTQRLRWAEDKFKDADRTAGGISFDINSPSLESAVYALKDAYDLIHAQIKENENSYSRMMLEKSEIGLRYYNVISSPHSTQTAKSVFSEHLESLAEVCGYAAGLIEIHTL